MGAQQAKPTEWVYSQSANTNVAQVRASSVSAVAATNQTMTTSPTTTTTTMTTTNLPPAAPPPPVVATTTMTTIATEPSPPPPCQMVDEQIRALQSVIENLRTQGCPVGVPPTLSVPPPPPPPSPSTTLSG